MTPWRERTAVVLIIAVVIGFAFLRFFGSQFFQDDWSFQYWQHQPWWYTLVWSIFFVAAMVFAFLKSKEVAEFFNSRLRRISGLLLIIVILVLFQSDSILYAGGNLKVAQLAQTDYIIPRWFEFGSSLLATSFYELYKLFGIVSNSAAAFAWNTLLWISVLLSLFGSILITGEFTKRFEIRFWLFLIIFFGPQTLAYLGLMGPNITLIPVLLWLTIFAFRAMKNRSVTAMLMVWIVVLVGTAFNYLAAFFVPAAVYVTLRSTLHLKRWSLLTILSTTFSLAIVVAALYFWGMKNLELSGKILFLDGKNPLSDYGLFSDGHLKDMLQILLLVFPQIIVVLFLIFSERRHPGNFFLNGFSWLLFFTGLLMLFVIDPVNSIVLDLPRLVVFLTCAGILSASVVRLSLEKTDSTPRLPALMAVFAFFLPLSFTPFYSKISSADSYMSDYLESHEPRIISSATALRDSYFYKKNFDKANEWDQYLRVKSGDFLGFTGAQVLAEQGKFDGAAEEYFRLKTKYPYWAQPRASLAQVELALSQFEKARAELDTLLMLEPYNKSFHEQLVKYYLMSKNYIAALNAVNVALRNFPANKNLLIDKMNALYQNGKVAQADSLARDLIRVDSTLPYPYLFRGLILDREQNPQLAARNYRKYITLSPDSPETPEVRKRLNDIILKLRGDSATAEN